VGPGQPGDDAALAGVGPAQQDHLPGPLARDLVADAPLFGAALLLLDLLLRLADLGLQLGLELLAGLVLGQQGPHALQAVQRLLGGGVAPLVRGCGFRVLRGGVGAQAPPRPPARWRPPRLTVYSTEGESNRRPRKGNPPPKSPPPDAEAERGSKTAGVFV